MRLRISLIGNAGSGKTTLARKLSATLGIQHLELDRLVWRHGAKHDERQREDVEGRVPKKAIPENKKLRPSERKGKCTLASPWRGKS